MKKKFFVILLGIAFTLSGCSTSDNKETSVSNDMEVKSETEPVRESESEEPQVKETNSYLISILEEPEDGTYEALGSDGVNYLLALDESFPEDGKELLKPGEVLSVDAWEEDEEEESELKKLCVVNAAVSDDTLDAVTLKKAAFERINGFAVDDSISAAMYAKDAVNVRRGPSTDYEQIGKLLYGEEVNVTGMADNGWYRISYGEEEGYVSNKYLITMEPSTTAASSQAGTGASSNTSVASNGNDSASALGLPYSEEEIDAVMNSGDLKRAWEMNQANLDALNGGGTGGASSAAASNPEPVEKNMAGSSEFVDYLNAQRETAGLPRLEWSDSLAQTAKERSGEIVDDFSHNGSRNCSGEIITQTNSGDVSTWYSNFYNSPGHKAHMMDAGLYTKVGAGVCQAGNRYYVVVLFDYVDR